MKFKEYNPVDEKGGCVARSISKALNKDYMYIKEELIKLANDLGKEDYRDDAVFEKYILDNGFKVFNNYNDKIVNECDFSNDTFVIFGYKGDWYHLVTIIDNTIYDKSNDSLELRIIKVYKMVINS